MTDLREFAIGVLFVWMIIDSIVVFPRRSSAAENRDRSSLKVLMIGSMLTLWSSIGLAFSGIGTFSFPDLQMAGFLVMAIGIVVRSTAIAQLGRFHTPNVAVRVDHQLTQTGLYGIVRHPSYLGALIAFAGFGLALGNWLSLLLLAAGMPGLYLFRIREEDAAMLAAFGEPYRAYCARTKRLIPWLF